MPNLRKNTTEVINVIDEAEAGEFRDIDDYIKELRDAGYDADYENVIVETANWVAKVYVNGYHHANWEGEGGSQMVRAIEWHLADIDEMEHNEMMMDEDERIIQDQDTGVFKLIDTDGGWTVESADTLERLAQKIR